MTIKELSQFYYLNQEIKLCRKQLAELEAQRGVGSVLIDDMPHGKGPAKSRVEQLAGEIVDLKAIIHAKQIECIHERNRLERYIAGVTDSETRLILSLRFADCLSWDEVAEQIGEGNTADRVKKVCYRFLERDS